MTTYSPIRMRNPKSQKKGAMTELESGIPGISSRRAFR